MRLVFYNACIYKVRQDMPADNSELCNPNKGLRCLHCLCCLLHLRRRRLLHHRPRRSRHHRACCNGLRLVLASEAVAAPLVGASPQEVQP